MTSEHGGHLRDFSARFQVPESEIVDFSSNINPLGLPEAVRRLYLESVHDVTRYPDPDSHFFRLEAAKQFSLNPMNILAGNGAVSLLALAVRVLAPRRALIIEPCFSEYHRILEQNGADVLALELREQDDFKFHPERITGALSGIDLLVLGHPNNPTGTALNRLQMLELLEQARLRNVFVLIDEAFADWVPEISVVDHLREDSRFLVVRSLTKFYALAGLRAGFAVGPSALITEMKKKQEAWSMNRLAEKLAVAVLQDSQFREWTLRWFQRESALFFKDLQELGVLKVYPGQANFFLARLEEAVTPSHLTESLGKQGIYIRSCENFRGLNASYFRFALRQRAENRLLLEAIRECLDSSAPSFSTL